MQALQYKGITDDVEQNKVASHQDYEAQARHEGTKNSFCSF
jgi:hypothetical protein